MTKPSIAAAISQAMPLSHITSMDNPINAGFTSHRVVGESVFDLHYELELGVMLTGKMMRIWSDCQWEIQPGDIWLSSMGEPHGYEITQASSEVLVFLIRPELLSGCSLGPGVEMDWMAPFLCPANERPMMKEAGKNNLLESVKQLKPRENGLVEDSPSLRLLLLQILSSLMDGWTIPERDYVPHEFSRLQPVLERIYQTTSLFPSYEAASLCSMGESTFLRHFKRNFGISFGRFILNHRLQQAASRLVSTDEPIKQIASDYDFSDLSHFYKAFKGVYRDTPGDYRKKSKQKLSY